MLGEGTALTYFILSLSGSFMVGATAVMIALRFRSTEYLKLLITFFVITLIFWGTTLFFVFYTFSLWQGLDVEAISRRQLDVSVISSFLAAVGWLLINTGWLRE